MEEYKVYMKRALELAELGRGKANPNPMVGCVIVHNDKIIGEGWHKLYGGPHAEVNAIKSVVQKELLPDTTLYVTLEPCSHFGKTPPCADLIIEHNIKRVVICNIDSNPLVGGKGIQKLLNAGIVVETGVLAEAGRELNKRFFTFIEKQRPYIILKWAQTADGFIAREDYTSKWISNELSRKIVHKWRTEEAGIMVGTKTALRDNPQLDVRHWLGDAPVRIVIDKNLVLPNSLNLFNNKQTTYCYNNISDNVTEFCHLIKIDFSIPIIPQILNDLYQRKVISVIVEGGAILLNEFIQSDIWDEIRCFKSSGTFGKGIKAPELKGVLVSEEKVLNDTLSIYKPIE